MSRKSAQVSLLPNSVLLGVIWDHLKPRRRLQLRLLIIIMITSGVAELLSLGAVIPFLAVLSDPGRLWENSYIQDLAIRFGFTHADQLIWPASVLFAFAAISSACIRLANLFLNGRLAAAIGSDLSIEAYRRTLYQPYEVHVQRNSSKTITNITTQVALTVGALESLLQLLTAVLISTGLLIGLFIINSQIAFLAIGLFGLSYGALALTARRKLQSNGQLIALATNKQLQVLQEGLGAIRDVLLDGSQTYYLDVYQRADRNQRRLQATNNFLASFPRFALEAFGLVIIAILGALLVLKNKDASYVFTLLGAMALGAQRLLPALQQIYSQWAALRAYNAALNGIVSMLKQPLPKIQKSYTPLNFKNSIRFNNVSFNYSLESPRVLERIKFEIYKGQSIGIIGTTGSGKSTVIDLLMGLLKPQLGEVYVDEKNIHDPRFPNHINSWYASIAHVPQSIYLADSTISENIAFGIPKSQINMDLVKKAASQAQIAKFIENSSSGYDTFVGERGIKLSGGQRQRIGIARALYKNASVLILDEATSALDNRTEESLMETINNFDSKMTIIMVAHRISTIEKCDRIMLLEHGRIKCFAAPSEALKYQK